MAQKKKKQKKNGKGLTLYTTLIMYSMIPLVVGCVLITSVLLTKSKNMVKSIVSDYMYTVAISEGANLEEMKQIEGDAALTPEFLDEFCSEIKLTNVASSYCYVADENATMLWHPTAEKIGQPVSNEAILKVCADLKDGKDVSPDFASYNFNGAEKYAAFYPAPDHSFVLVISADEVDFTASINQMVVFAIIILVVLIIFFIFLAIMFAKKIATPLKQLSSFTNELANGNLNATTDASSNIVETTDLIVSLAALQDALKTTVGSVIENASSLDSAVINVDDKATSNATSSSQINDAIGEVAETSQSVAESAQEMAEKADQLGINIDQLVNNVTNLKAASDEISMVNAEAVSSMHTVMSSSSQSVQAVGNISDKINETNDAVSKISECVQMIEDIASQTNLLSLNASIEAARAGEAGKGFAVVAEEIRKLADDSQSSATEIKEIIDRVIEISAETVSAAQQVTETISHEQTYISETQEKFTNLSSSVEQSIEEISNIQNMTDDLEQIRNELTGSITELSAISQELGATAEEVSSSCHVVAEACTETQHETTLMRAIGESLGKAIEVFKL